MKKFPYYIVRFKQKLCLKSVVILQSFHTTQYDLNSRQVARKSERRSEFPYYIVRFKPPFHFQCWSNYFKFPYYIVRFKPFIALLTDTKPQCFHTTQYDLNRIENKKKEANACFHTTQYDLNLFLQTLQQVKNLVSILHSTI